MSAQGFYVFPNECIGCGAPESVAPDLMGHDEAPHYGCRFLRQPETPAEVDQAIAAVNASCCGAVQYLGDDPVILKRMGLEQQVRVDQWRAAVSPITWGTASVGEYDTFVLETPRRRWLRRGFLAGWMVLLAGSAGKAVLVTEPTEMGMWLVLGAFAGGLFCFGGWMSQR